MRKFFILLLCAAFSFTLSARVPLRIACVGDSITFGACIDDREQNCYPTQLQRLMGDAYEVRNFGFSARVMTNAGDYPYMKEDMYSEMKAWLPDVVVIMLGTNDTKPQNWDPVEFEKAYRTMFDELKGLDSHPDIYFCYPPTVVTDRWGINEKLVVEGVMPIIDKIGRVQFDIIDTHSATAGMPENYVGDGVHPNAAGAGVLARTVADALAKNGYGPVPGKRLLFIGDSISDGEWGGGGARPSKDRNHYDYNHVYGHGFPEMIIGRLAADYPGKEMRFFNRGISGGTLPKMVARWDGDVLAVHPDIISILIGVNDTHSGTVDTFDFAGWEAQYRSIIDRTLASDPDVKFVLCSPFLTDSKLSGDNPEYRRRHDVIVRLADIVSRIASDYGFTYVDTFGLFEGLTATNPSCDHRYWMWDGVHPTTAGHQKMADLWLKTVGKRAFK